MIIYGVRSTHLQTFTTQATCTSCGTPGQTVVSVFGRYAHIFWIPLFPVGKTVAGQCQHCQRAYKAKELPDSLKAESKDMRAQTKAPVWHYSGLSILVLLFGFGYYTSKQAAAETALYFADPKPGDKYEYEAKVDSQSVYTYFKIATVKKDTIWVFQNQYWSDKITRAYKIDSVQNYDTTPTPILRTDLAAMKQAGKILHISR